MINRNDASCRNQQKDAQELDIGKMHLDAIRKLGSGKAGVFMCEGGSVLGLFFFHFSR